MADLSTEFTGIRFPNPFMLASAPPTEQPAATSPWASPTSWGPPLEVVPLAESWSTALDMLPWTTAVLLQLAIEPAVYHLQPPAAVQGNDSLALVPAPRQTWPPP